MGRIELSSIFDPVIHCLGNKHFGQANLILNLTVPVLT